MLSAKSYRFSCVLRKHSPGPVSTGQEQEQISEEEALQRESLNSTVVILPGTETAKVQLQHNKTFLKMHKLIKNI